VQIVFINFAALYVQFLLFLKEDAEFRKSQFQNLTVSLIYYMGRNKNMHYAYDVYYTRKEMLSKKSKSKNNLYTMSAMCEHCGL
jgi:hypothetical protein